MNGSMTQPADLCKGTWVFPLFQHDRLLIRVVVDPLDADQDCRERVQSWPPPTDCQGVVVARQGVATDSLSAVVTHQGAATNYLVRPLLVGVPPSIIRVQLMSA
jgi:hypothetical protein